MSGALLGLFLALCAVTWKIDQIIAGTVINIFVAGLTSFLYAQGKQLTGSLAQARRPAAARDPAGRRGAVQQHADRLHGHRPRRSCSTSRCSAPAGVCAAGPSASTRAPPTRVGINVGLKRYVNIALAGGLAGLGGAFLSLEAVGTFERGMSAQRGFTALAIMIFGRWKPILAWSGALFFAFTSRLAAQLQFDQVIDVPPQFINILPYVLVILVLAMFAGRVRPPAAAGQPYVKE